MTSATASAQTGSPTWEVIITEWALDSYLNLKANKTFTDQDYWTILRPDVELLKTGIPSTDPKFALSAFWGPAKVGNQVLAGGYKMKWRNLGPGQVQLRLPVAAGSRGSSPAAFLCKCYEKQNPSYEQRQLARFKTHMNLIASNQYQYRGSL